ncbi:ABC transporter substrate-binding protein [Rhodoligotrophos defluvii]|uniref:ABC transporter substrate-binding protein n=1 Tax=Rhodoligotrophos defluvii TaxID=2561934 RepID=UPI0010C9CEAE|nr:ABC transporter substrate-binding protein [Rhodoligotrophos defluvii]
MSGYLVANRRQFGKLAAGLALSTALPGLGVAATGEPFKLGALNSITGAGGVYGPGMLEAIQIAVAEVNNAGGAAGRPFQVFAEDDQTKPDAAVLAVKKLVDITRVEAVVGIWSSSVQLATLPITNAAEILSLNTCGAPEIETEDKLDLVWQFYASNAIIGRAFAQIARARGFKRPGILAYNNSTMLAQANYFKKAWEDGGGEIAEFVVYEPNQTSYRTELDRVLSKNPDIVSLSSYSPDVTILLKEWYQTGQECKFIAPGYSVTQAVGDTLGPDITSGIITVSNVPASANEAYQVFVDAFKAKTGREPEMFAAAAYDMVITLALAMELAGPDAKSPEIASKIRSVTNAPGTKVSTFVEGRDLIKKGEEIDYEGASSSLEFGSFGNTTPDFGVFEFVDGKVVLKDVMKLEA